jgi:lipoate-protein ligase A
MKESCDTFFITSGRNETFSILVKRNSGRTVVHFATPALAFEQFANSYSFLVSEEISASFRRFGQLVVDWPHKAESKSFFPPKGYAFLLFQVTTIDIFCYLV